MLSALSLTLLGFVLGIRHALDPDHVVAISTIATSSPSLRRAARVGALWGLGHTVTLLAVGGAMIGMRVAIAPRAAAALELVAALMLVALGVSNLVTAQRSAPPQLSSARPLIVGMIHGVAGSAAIALLVLAAVARPSSAVLYLLVFSAGTILGMVLITALLSVPASWALGRLGITRRWLMATTGVASVGFGLLMARALSASGALLSAPSIGLR